MGQKALLSGWSLVLAGKESEIPSILGAREDTICILAQSLMKKEKDKGK